MSKEKFEKWFEETKNLYSKNNTDKLDEVAAKEAFYDGLTPEEYIQELDDSLD